jgi:hypothetical protein
LSGKTILASVIIEDCLQDNSFETSFFYCKYDGLKNNCASIFKGLLSQLICHCRDLVPFCHDKYLASGGLTLTSTSLARELLELFCQRLSKQYIIVDGLDECDAVERKLVLSVFNSIIDRHEMKEPGKLRVLFLSRDENDIRKGLATATWINIGPTANADDIKSFVHKWCIEIRQKFELDSDLVDQIIESTCIRAKGIQLAAAFNYIIADTDSQACFYLQSWS